MSFTHHPRTKAPKATSGQNQQLPDQRCDERDAKHASVPRRRVRADEVRREDFLYELKAGPAARNDTSATGEPASPSALGDSVSTVD